MNKALDFNGLLEAQKNKLQLKKQLKFPLWAELKLDGNYVSVKVEDGKATFITSGNLQYTHDDMGGYIFQTLPNGVYLAERIAGKGKLGDRVRCNLTGPKIAQKSIGHTYTIHDWIPINDWVEGNTIFDYAHRSTVLVSTVPSEFLPLGKLVFSIEELDDLLKMVCNDGYEGLMLKQLDWKWKNTNSRTVDLCKYKKRRTADLRCIGVTGGEGKYNGKIGSLTLQDSNGRVCNVGSGLSDSDRSLRPEFFIGRIIEVEYEQIIDTYIQPTFIGIRFDKEVEE